MPSIKMGNVCKRAGVSTKWKDTCAEVVARHSVKAAIVSEHNVCQVVQPAGEVASAPVRIQAC